MTPWYIRTSLLGAALLAPATAFAGPSECDAIAKAMLAITEVPAVRQSLTPNGPNMISLQDAMYLQGDAAGPWRKMPIDAGARRKLAEMGLKSLPLGDCEAKAGETLNGVAVDVYAYTQPNPMKAGAKETSRILIGKSDGLPLRLDLPNGSAMTFEYDGVKAPTP